MQHQYREQIYNFYLKLYNLNIKLGESYVGFNLHNTNLNFEEVFYYSSASVYLFKFNKSPPTYYLLQEIKFHISEKEYIEKQLACLSFYSYSYLINKLKYYD